MSNLICVCNEEDMFLCDRCGKYKDIKPDVCLRNDAWPRDSRGHIKALGVRPDLRKKKALDRQ
jgi:hypothetical protein